MDELYKWTKTVQLIKYLQILIQGLSFQHEVFEQVKLL